ncbi:IS1595 family transposase [Wenyingzhuangia sp. 2_MG-2023]|uniref:IS1595 family transposase n=1 Tax=Wenyingzhuangia sp. 2_MG-2023 TaxID=3062639 RepID=UPI0026E47F44|nr:IS1595 family transposase [Wenyingzhuangia sp. 2_MG-2023]MDO6737114.1 IS1595 family transposase [Wenyingzhuangia sp. 2_MG-2023]
MISNDFNSILELINAFPNEQACINHLEKLRWNGNVVSPFDNTSKVYNCKGNKYKCKNTGKYFNVRTQTIFDNTKMPLQKWFLAIWLVTSHKKGISSLQLGRDLDITQKSAWFMLQRIRNCFGIDNDAQLNNEVEVDETYVGGKNKNRHANKKIKNSQGRSSKDKTPVVGMVERGGIVTARAVDNVKSVTLTAEIIRNVKESAKLYSDEWLGYNGIARIYDHSIVKHNQGQYVNGRIHTNTIEGFWSLLKRGIFGIYHFTSKKHLQMYVDEFVFRYNTRKGTESNRFNLLLNNIENRITYKELING